MRKRLAMVVLLAATGMAVSACSARGQFFERVTRENGAHFATWNHMGYSVWRASPKDTSRQDVAMAQSDKCTPSMNCPWFGEVVRVEPIQ